VEDDERRPARRLPGQRRNIREQVAPVNRRRVPPRGLHRQPQALAAVGLARPDQALQPAHVVIAGDVERVEVQPRAPGDLGDAPRQRHRAVRVAGDHRRPRVAAGDPVARVIVGIPVREQGEPGARAHLEEGKWLRQHSEQRKQGGAARGLVCLGTAGKHHRAQLGVSVSDEGAQRGDVRGLAEQVAGGREEQVRLLPGARQAVQESQQARVRGGLGRQSLIPRGPAAGLPGERPVVLRRADGQVVAAHGHAPRLARGTMAR
jgi:hypothetical protein